LALSDIIVSRIDICWNRSALTPLEYSKIHFYKQEDTQSEARPGVFFALDTGICMAVLTSAAPWK
jgi:hypothetical protein